MATTRNGWATAPVARVAINAPGCTDTGEVRAGDVATVMQALALAFDAEVEPLSTINGYRTPAYNASVGGDPDSNHISGTALDLNGGRHPYEANLPASQRGANYRHGFTTAQVAAVRALLARFSDVIAWGLDFNVGYRDAMHFEIRGAAADVARVAAKVTGKATPIPTQEDDMPLNAADISAIDKAVSDRIDQRLRQGGEWGVVITETNVQRLDKLISDRMDARLNWLVTELPKRLPAGTAGAIDYAALAKAVNDDAARRLAQ